MGASRSEICGAGWQADNSQARANVAVLKQNYFFLQGTSVFALKVFQLDWMRTTHIMVGNLYLKSTDYRCSPNLQHISRTTPRLVFHEITGYYRLIKLTYKTNHHGNKKG